MDRQNLTLLTDLYELTMMQGYFRNKDQNETVIFDAFSAIILWEADILSAQDLLRSLI